MRNKYVSIIAIMLFFTLICSQAGATEGTVMSTETKERIIEQYGLDSPVTGSPEWSGMDVGISSPIDVFVMLCRFIVSPLVFTIQEIL
ncbi:hypothetical protein [Paenibacillus borealis]|uniref:Uncharacterized protein n=1 Tax=Paenibacillus borealis TaxID=160799 RepID=A0A089MRB1_PAEBO|nr:hypothetical protein [Paenibacillus borealis]AIQ59024.1 hypothetical protein PBOR_20370 [Paenibacillus borealis]